MIIKKSKEEILNNMLDNLPSEYDKTEGGLFYDNLAPVSIELSNFRDIVDYVHKMGFADTSISIHALLKRATALAFAVAFFKGISIHALLKRATLFL